MSLIREYVRELLNEAAKGINDMKNMKVYYTADDSNIQVWLASARAVDHVIKHGNAAKIGIVAALNQVSHGTIEAKRGTAAYNCGDTYVIAFSEVDQKIAKGFGPMLYDVVMELASEWASGLSPDRTNVSDAAFNVWDYYHKKRGDIEITQLDDAEGRLTPDDGSDDCYQDAAYGGGDGRYGWWDEYDEDTPWDPDGKEVLLNSPLSKIYRSKGAPTLEALESQNKLIDIYGLEYGS